MIYNTFPLNIDFTSIKNDIYFLDIETTGLCKQADKIIAISLIHYTNKSLIFHQWCIEKKEEEKSLLSTLFSLITDSARIYTYNGRRFDIPFLESKANLFELSLDISWTWVDFKDLSTFKHLLKVYSSKRQLFEQLICYNRTITTNGKEIAKLGKLILDHPDPIYTKVIMSHNEEEVLSLVYFYQLHQFLLSLSSHDLLETPKFTPSEDTITFSLKCTYQVNFSIVLDIEPYHLNYTPSASTISLSVTLLKDDLYHYLNHKDYFIVDGQLLHASLARFIPSQLKSKPKKHHCFLTQFGIFIPCTQDTTDKIWEDKYHTPYLMLTPDCDFSNVILCFTQKFTHHL